MFDDKHLSAEGVKLLEVHILAIMTEGRQLRFSESKIGFQ